MPEPRPRARHPRALSTRSSRRLDHWPLIDSIEELKSTTLLQKYITLWHIYRPYRLRATRHGNALWEPPLNLSRDPDRRTLHAQEIELASHLRLPCAQYLSVKRGMFHGKLRALKAGASFGPTQYGRVAAAGAVLGRLYESLGWFEEKWFTPWMEINEERYLGPGAQPSVASPSSATGSATDDQAHALRTLPQLMGSMTLSAAPEHSVIAKEMPRSSAPSTTATTKGRALQRHMLRKLQAYNKAPVPRKFTVHERSQESYSSSLRPASSSHQLPNSRGTTTARAKTRGQVEHLEGQRPIGVTKIKSGRSRKHRSVAKGNRSSSIAGPQGVSVSTLPPKPRDIKPRDIEPREKAETTKEKATNAIRQKLAIAMRRQPRIPNAQFFAARRDEGPIVSETQAHSEV
ncbi:unnamed protein product [Zymoseptoria tritici ST99CH_1A5]|uniref:SWIRM domain-containing protein n=1 Tax=Zymoseptoria tritici ST99CH_1A5 TaxID=1276529 RepID=A0A1Y6LZQ0_ZYMTR|nr:unnamed protein product [Zymoseptoria tritici ST99CH_1A5]